MFKPYGKRSVNSFVTASRISDRLDSWPVAYSRLQWLRLRSARDRMVGPETSLVIEAFPRSGSSFAHQAFVAANPGCKGRVATHMHRVSQVTMAVRANLPTLILVRPPREAVLSLLAMAIQNDKLPMTGDRDTVRCMKAMLLRYTLFHERIVELPDVIIAGFDEVTEDFGKVISRVNASFGTDFALFDHTEEAVAALRKTTRRHTLPNAERTTIKDQIGENYESPALAGLRARAEAVHAQMIARRDTQLAGSIQ